MRPPPKEEGRITTKFGMITSLTYDLLNLCNSLSVRPSVCLPAKIIAVRTSEVSWAILLWAALGRFSIKNGEVVFYVNIVE